MVRKAAPGTGWPSPLFLSSFSSPCQQLALGTPAGSQEPKGGEAEGRELLLDGAARSLELAPPLVAAFVNLEGPLMVHLLPLPRFCSDPFTRKTPSQMPVEWPSPLRAPPLGPGNTHSFLTPLLNEGGSRFRCNHSPSVLPQPSPTLSDRVSLQSLGSLHLQAPLASPPGEARASDSCREMMGE